MTHLVMDITAHGFGHLAQTAAVLNALPANSLKLTVRSLAPADILHERIRYPFKLIPYQQDNGMVMLDALRVDATASFAWYEAFHKNFPQRIQQASQDLARLKPDVLLTNVPYLSLEAAYHLNIPSIALCSLNWADLFKAYCSAYRGAVKIYTQIQAAYSKASLFLRPLPAMPMKWLTNTQTIQPLVAKGRRQTQYLHQQLGLSAEIKIVLVSLGGLGIEYPLITWPYLLDVVWIFPDKVLAHQQRSDWFKQSQTQLSNYLDLLASCDVVLTKTGYGTQTEVVVNQIPTLCVDREDWPEQPYLNSWHQQYGEVRFINWQQLTQTDIFVDHIQQLLAVTWQKPEISHQGAQQAAFYLNSYFKSN